MQRPAPFPARLPALAAAALLACTASLRAEAQALSSEPASVALVAHVLPVLTLQEISQPAITRTDSTTVVTRQLVTSANVPYQVVVRLASRADAGRGPIEVRNRDGAWVRVAPGERATVLETKAADGTHTVDCRVSGDAPRSAGCPFDLELVSVDPMFPLRVTAAVPAALEGT